MALENTNNVISIAAVGVLTAVAIWAILYGLIVTFVGTQARIKVRVKQFVANEGQPALSEEEVRERQRETLFAELDSRWEDRSLFRALSEEIDAADLHITPSELLLIQVSLGTAVG